MIVNGEDTVQQCFACWKFAAGPSLACTSITAAFNTVCALTQIKCGGKCT